MYALRGIATGPCTRRLVEDITSDDIGCFKKYNLKFSKIVGARKHGHVVPSHNEFAVGGGANRLIFDVVTYVVARSRVPILPGTHDAVFGDIGSCIGQGLGGKSVGLPRSKTNPTVGSNVKLCIAIAKKTKVKANGLGWADGVISESNTRARDGFW